MLPHILCNRIEGNRTHKMLPYILCNILTFCACCTECKAACCVQNVRQLAERIHGNTQTECVFRQNVGLCCMCCVGLSEYNTHTTQQSATICRKSPMPSPFDTHNLQQSPTFCLKRSTLCVESHFGAAPPKWDALHSVRPSEMGRRALHLPEMSPTFCVKRSTQSSAPHIQFDRHNMQQSPLNMQQSPEGSAARCVCQGSFGRMQGSFGKEPQHATEPYTLSGEPYKESSISAAPPI